MKAIIINASPRKNWNTAQLLKIKDMKKQAFEVKTDGFHGTWFPNPDGRDKGVILMLGDSSNDYMARCGAKWLQKQGCHVMGIS